MTPARVALPTHSAPLNGSQGAWLRASKTLFMAADGHIPLCPGVTQD